MKRILLFALPLMGMMSCVKRQEQEDALIKTFNGNLPIVAATTPNSVAAGQDIRTSVKCQLSGISGSVIFEGFDITEVSPQRIDIKAKALYKDWHMQITSPVLWTLDTVATVRTSAPGIYILRFYSGNETTESDTVLVN